MAITCPEEEAPSWLKVKVTSNIIEPLKVQCVELKHLPRFALHFWRDSSSSEVWEITS